MHDLLRSVWDESRAPDPPRRVWRDWVLVGVLVPAAGLEWVLRPDLPWRTAWIAVTVALVPTLLWRRTRPLSMVAIAFVTCGLTPLFTAGQAPDVHTLGYLLLLPYALFRWGSGREAVLGAAVVLGKIGFSAALGHLDRAGALGGLVVLFSVSALGAVFRYRATARVRELDRVKLLERERLARDLHDTVAHHMSAIAIRAQAGLATVASRPDAAADALRVIEAEASRALAEMRTMVRVLRRDELAGRGRAEDRSRPGYGDAPADRSPTPSIADLGRLAGRPDTGPAVDVGIAGDTGDLPPSVGAAIYRLAQESVTNARRHARHATRIEVRVAADDTSVHLRVSDDGDAGAGRPGGPPGYGLIGMIERADLLGGTCAAGPNADRGWTVTATLPRTGPAA